MQSASANHQRYITSWKLRQSNLYLWWGGKLKLSWYGDFTWDYCIVPMVITTPAQFLQVERREYRVLGDICMSPRFTLWSPKLRSLEFDCRSCFQQQRSGETVCFIWVKHPVVSAAAAHVSFPGVGHIRADNQGYAWVLKMLAWITFCCKKK